MRLLLTLPLLGALLVPARAALATQSLPPAAGQPPTRTATPDPAPRLLLPGDSALRGDKVKAGIWSYALTVVREGVEQPLGTITDVISHETEGSAPGIRRVQTVRRGALALVDSSMTEAGSLAPRWHRSLQPNRRIALAYAGKRIRGSLAPTDAPSLPIDTTVAVAPFDSGNWDLLVRSLPLEQDYAVRFPVYDVDSGLREYAVRVTGSATMLGEEAHIVRFFLAPSRAATLWVGKQSRTLLGMETLLGPTMLLRQELVKVEK